MSLLVIVSPAVVWAQEAQTLSRLQLAGGGKPDSLDVSPDGKYAVAVTRDIRIEGHPPRVSGMDTVLYLFDTETGKPVELPEPLQSGEDVAWSSTGFSANGQWLCLRKLEGPMGPGKEMSVWLYNTETGSARKIEAPARGPARWVGNRYFYSSMGPGGIEPLKAYDPVKDQTTELPIRGFLAGATSDGKTLLIAGHPEDLAKNVAPREMQAGAAVHLATSQGKILQTICEAGDLSSAPTLSPEGKYVAFQSGPRGRPRGPRDPKDFSVRLIRAEDGQASSLSGMYSPIAVTDQGLVCAREVSAGPQAAPLVLLDLETDKATKLLDATGEATTSQAGKVYFLQEVEGKPGAFALKCVELKAR